MTDSAPALIERARRARRAARLDEAIACYRAAAAIARSEGDVAAFAHRLRHAGDLLLEQGDLAAAEDALAEALASYRGRDDCPSLDLANALRPMAMLRERQGDRDAAASLWREARAHYAAAGVAAGVAETEAHIDGPAAPAR